MGKVLSGKLSCFCDRSCFKPILTKFQIEPSGLAEGNILQIVWVTEPTRAPHAGANARLQLPGHVAQSVGHLTRKSEVLALIPGLAIYFCFSFR